MSSDLVGSGLEGESGRSSDSRSGTFGARFEEGRGSTDDEGCGQGSIEGLRSGLVGVDEPDEGVVTSLDSQDRASRGQIAGIFDVSSRTEVSGYSCYRYESANRYESVNESDLVDEERLSVPRPSTT